jgi:hypothetical protein
VHEEVEPSVEYLPDLAEDPRNVVVGADVTFRHQWAGDGLGEFADTLLDPLALIRERQLGPGVGESPRDRAGDRSLVRDAENQPTLAFIASAHPASINPFR